MDPDPSAVANAERAIRGYLQTHPNAIDTERGIGEWWLAMLATPCSPAELHAAIHKLVAAGVLLPLTLPDGHRAYGGARSARP
jgi:hypothetical protein